MRARPFRLSFDHGRYRLTVTHLLAALVVLFVVLPLADSVDYGNLIESVLFTVVLLAAVNAIGGRREAQVAAVLLAAPAIAIRWVHHFWPHALPIDLSLIAAALYVVFVVWHLFRYVLAAPYVSADVLCAAISIYLLFAVAYGFIYTLLEEAAPGSFAFSPPYGAEARLSGFTALYFSVQILTTVTFGDIMPATNVARMLALVESTIGMFYLAILISRLVGLYSSAPPPEEPGGEA